MDKSDLTQRFNVRPASANRRSPAKQPSKEAAKRLRLLREIEYRLEDIKLEKEFSL